MQFEVEQKFPVAGLDEVAAKLRALGAAVGQAIVQVDRYFAHPAKDFAQTDEALRLRQVGERNFITYKGPRIDRVTKTRREVELPLGSGENEAAQWAGMLEALGFRPVAEVRKRRQYLELTWDAGAVEAALDQVEEVGEIREVGQDIGRDEQRGVDVGGLGLGQEFQFAFEVIEQGVSGLRRADDIANLTLDVNALGEGAEIQADHRALQPFAGGGDDFGVVGY